MMMPTRGGADASLMALILPCRACPPHPTARRRHAGPGPGPPSRSVPSTVTWPILRAGRERLAVQVQVGLGDPGQRRGLPLAGIARRTPPTTFAITATGATASVGPSGQSRTARRCCSNCEVAVPSMVRCPELWTRGAISFTSTSPSTTNSSTAITPTASDATGHLMADLPARSRSPASTGAGRTTSSHMPSTCTVSSTGQLRTWPDGRPGHQHRHLGVQRQAGLQDQRGTAPVGHEVADLVAVEHPHASAVVPAAAGLGHHRTAVARGERGRGGHRRRCRRRGPRTRARAVPRRRRRGAGGPCRRTRACAPTGAPPRRPPPGQRSTAWSTFSWSKVTTSTVAAKRRSASGVVRGRRPPCPAPPRPLPRRTARPAPARGPPSGWRPRPACGPAARRRRRRRPVRSRGRPAPAEAAMSVRWCMPGQEMRDTAS